MREWLWQLANRPVSIWWLLPGWCAFGLVRCWWLGRRTRRQLAAINRQLRREARRLWAQQCPYEAGRDVHVQLTGPGWRAALHADGWTQVYARHPAEAALIVELAPPFRVPHPGRSV